VLAQKIRLFVDTGGFMAWRDTAPHIPKVAPAPEPGQTGPWARFPKAGPGARAGPKQAD